ncbi:MAG: chromate transporter, partial [Treponema sp.]|nr:chromate transporter [Treponema sp.]
SMLPIIDRELCQKRSWVTQEELIDYFAIGQVTPGIVAVNVATFCGHKLKGTFGGIVATIAVVTPSVLVISLLASCISAVDNIPVIKKALMGINVAVAANLSFSVIKFFKKSVVSILGFFLFAAAFVLVFFFKFSAVLVIFASGLLGALLYFAAKRLNGDKAENAAGEERK